MITTEELYRMDVELETGKPPSLTTPEANAIREILRKEGDAIRAKGGQVDCPHEIPNPNDEN
jgi:hypothetical protein